MFRIVSSLCPSVATKHPNQSPPSVLPGRPAISPETHQQHQSIRRYRRSVGMRRQQVIRMHRNQQSGVRVLFRNNTHGRSRTARYSARSISSNAEYFPTVQSKTQKVFPAVSRGCASRASIHRRGKRFLQHTRPRLRLAESRIAHAAANSPANRAWSGCVISHHPVFDSMRNIAVSLVAISERSTHANCATPATPETSR